MKQDAVLALAENVRLLMADRGDTQATLSQRAGVSQRAISDLLNYGKTLWKSPTMRTMDRLGDAYEVPVWQLTIPGISLDLLKSKRLAELITNYTDASERGRQTVEHIAESEARYAGSGTGATNA